MNSDRLCCRAISKALSLPSLVWRDGRGLHAGRIGAHWTLDKLCKGLGLAPKTLKGEGVVFLLFIIIMSDIGYLDC